MFSTLPSPRRIRWAVRAPGVPPAELGGGVEPRVLIKLIQGQPRAYRLEGQSRLHHHAALEAPAARGPAAAALLATLAGTPP